MQTATWILGSLALLNASTECNATRLGSKSNRNNLLDASKNRSDDTVSLKSLFKQQIFDIFQKALTDQSLDYDKNPAPGAAEGAATCYGSPKANLTMLTLAKGLPDDYSAALLRNRLKLATFGDYEYCQYNHVLDEMRDPAWSKVLALSALLEQGRQRVVWMDADAVMAHPKRFEDVAHSSKDLTFTNDFEESGTAASPSSSINTGVFMTQNSPWSRQFWSTVYKDFPNPEGKFMHPDIPDLGGNGRFDQFGVLMYRHEHPSDFAAHANIVGWRSMNTWLHQDDGKAFIVHAAGGAEAKGKYNDILHKYLS